MLPKSHRIKTEQFPAVTRGKTVQNEYFRVVVKSDNTLKNPKCAVIVSVKVAKTAVARNKIRRQVYEILHEIMDKLPISYISVMVKKIPAEFEDSRKSLKSLL